MRSTTQRHRPKPLPWSVRRLASKGTMWRAWQVFDNRIVTGWPFSQIERGLIEVRGTRSRRVGSLAISAVGRPRPH